LYNSVDTGKNLAKLAAGTAILSFWGLATCKLPSGGECQPYNWFPLTLCRGDVSYIIGSFELKASVAVLGSSFANSLTSWGTLQQKF